jgi:hypothetical protein
MPSHSLFSRGYVSGTVLASADAAREALHPVPVTTRTRQALVFNTTETPRFVFLPVNSQPPNIGSDCRTSQYIFQLEHFDSLRLLRRLLLVVCGKSSACNKESHNDN